MGDTDVLSLSLDEIIRRKRKDKSVKTKAVTRKFAARQRGDFKGRVARNRNQPPVRRNQHGTGISPIKRMNQSSRKPFQGQRNFRGGRQRQNSSPRFATNKPRYFNQELVTKPSTSRGFGTQKFRARRDANRFATRQHKLKLAIKSVQLARLRLRKLQSAMPLKRSGRQAISQAGVGRIRAGRFGFVTTRKTNMEARRTVIQQKIKLARMSRNRSASRNILSASSPPGPSRRQYRPYLDRTVGRSDWNPRSTFRNSDPESFRSRRSAFENEDWRSSRRSIQNDLYDPQTNALLERSGAGSGSRGLNPDLQRKISRIQEQGRMSRGEEKYDPITDNSDQFRRNIISSSAISLSDRFKSFMK